MIIALTQDEKSPFRSGKGHDRDTASDSDDDGIVEIKEENVGWAYVGSHNFTPSAWGTLSGSSFNPVMNVSVIYVIRRSSVLPVLSQITNYELGIVFPLRDEVHVDRVVCWKRPARKYTGGDVPWVRCSLFFVR